MRSHVKGKVTTNWKGLFILGWVSISGGKQLDLLFQAQLLKVLHLSPLHCQIGLGSI